jgi:hypothetical protein
MRDHRIHRYALLLFCLAMLVTDARQGVAQTGGLPPSLGSSMPSDIDLQSGFRLPFPKRGDLDEAGKRAARSAWCLHPVGALTPQRTWPEVGVAPAWPYALVSLLTLLSAIRTDGILEVAAVQALAGSPKYL